MGHGMAHVRSKLPLPPCWQRWDARRFSTHLRGDFALLAPVISHKLEAHLSAPGTQRNSVRRLILRPSSESLEVLGWDSPWPWTVKRSL